MGQFIDITGKKFGDVTVVKSTLDTNISGSRMWVCLCSCGKQFMCSTSSLNSGVKSCGCIARAKFAKRNYGRTSGTNVKPRGASNSKVIYRSIRDGAKIRGIEFEITYEQFLHLSSQECHYCGIEPRQCMKSEKSLRRFNGAYLYNGLDRVVNSIGYKIDNVVPCCITCNKAKGTMTVYEFSNWAKRLCQRFLQQFSEITMI